MIKKSENRLYMLKWRGVFAAFSLLPLVFAPLHSSYAQIAASPCDPVYYQSLEERAWLEAQREITQNQNLIFKPDSVLAYTCFHSYMNELADHAADMFSETTRWQDDVIDDQPLSMNQALQDLVIEALGTYLDSNFTSDEDRRYLGGRMASSPRTNPDDYATIANNTGYACNVMQEVWNFAKCYNFQAEARDGFFTFRDYANGFSDESRPRGLPSSCGGAGDEPELYEAAIEASMTNTPWPVDSTLTYHANLQAASCGASEMQPIATGVVVTRSHQSPQRYFEGVCVQPGCHFRPTDTAPTPPGTPTASGTCVP